MKVDEKEIESIFVLMGLGLNAWMSLEGEHFLLFRKLLNYPADAICSVLYHGPPTFESRRVLVDNLMAANVVAPEFTSKWKKINTRLQIASSHRTHIAHFELGFEIEFLEKNPLKYRYINPHLRPSFKNKLRSMQGKGYENPEYRVSRKKLSGYIDEFNGLKTDLIEFRKAIIIARLPRATRPRSEISQKPMSKVAPLLIRGNKNQKGEPPFGP